MKNFSKRMVTLSMCASMLFSAASCGGKNSDNWKERPSFTAGKTVELNKSVVRDKLLGSWIGSAIGLGSGYEYVTTLNNSKPLDGVVVDGTVAYVALDDKYWEPNGVICSDSIGLNALKTGPLNDPRVEYGKVYSDDDMHVDILNQFIFRDYGPDLGAQDIAAAWDKYAVADVGGGETVVPTIRNSGYIPPYTGQRMYGNTGYWVTESWIENESLGAIFPYMPGTLEAYAEIFTSVQGDALGMYLGKLCALMYSLAYEYPDTKVLLEKAFERMDQNNEIYEIYKYVLGCYEDGTDWRTACAGVVKNRVNCKLIGSADEAGFSINANAGMIFIGLLYGKNDFEKSVKITSLCGLDGDCTAATVGGLLGLIVGFDALPQKYKDFLNGNSVYYNYTGKNSDETGVYWGAFAYCGENFPTSLTFDQITDLTLKNLEAQVTARGGEIDGEIYRIASQPLEAIPQLSLTNKSFERGDIYGWSFEGTKGAALTTTEAKAHLGNYGGLIASDDIEGEGKAYQTVALVPGRRYRASIWINGCADREVRIFAGEKYRSYFNPITSNTAYVKLELYFTAEKNREDIGIKLMSGTDDSFSLQLNFDDFSVEDVTHLTDGSSQKFSAADFYVSPGLKTENDRVALECTKGLRFDFEGMKGYQTFKIYYRNTTGMPAQAEAFIDGKSAGVVPLPAQGADADGNEGNAAIAWLYAGAGDHRFKLVLNSFENIEIERIEVYGGNACFEK